jgi:CheY-like chemotaxis protein
LQVREAKGGNERILVVDDDDGMRRTVVKQLAALGYHVFDVSDAAAAIALLRRDPDFDLLLTDIVMPGSKSGAELARDARALIPGLKILLTTGFQEVQTNIGNLPDHAPRLLGKPYRANELARVVREVLDT